MEEDCCERSAMRAGRQNADVFGAAAAFCVAVPWYRAFHNRPTRPGAKTPLVACTSTTGEPAAELPGSPDGVEPAVARAAPTAAPAGPVRPAVAAPELAVALATPNRPPLSLVPGPPIVHPGPQAPSRRPLLLVVPEPATVPAARVPGEPTWSPPAEAPVAGGFRLIDQAFGRPPAGQPPQEAPSTAARPPRPGVVPHPEAGRRHATILATAPGAR
jgi:hypothetical protein